MTWRLTLPRSVLGVLVLISIAPAWSQTADDPARPSYSRLMNIDALIDNHARFLARRYNLSADQESYTQAFLHTKADQFLSKHREELYNLIDRLVDVRGGAEMNQQELMSWGKEALPLYEEAKVLIVQGNNDWRQTLTEDQKKVHDEDLREMYASFANTEDQLQRIVSGQMTLDEFRQGPGRSVPRLGPVPTPALPATPTSPKPAPTNPLTREVAPVAPASPNAAASGTTPTPTRPPVSSPSTPTTPPAAANPAPNAPGPASPGRTAKTNANPAAAGKNDGARGNRTVPGRDKPGASSADPESQWEQYVREFIQRFQLDDEQTQRANSVLKECQDQARRIMEKRKPEIERLDKKLLEIGASKDASGPQKLKDLAEINQQKAKLLEPVGEIFEKQLKPRLDKLPTRAQRQAAEAAGGKAPAPGGKTDKGDKGGRTRPQPATPPAGAPNQPQPVPVPPTQPPPPPPPPPQEAPAQESPPPNPE